MSQTDPRATMINHLSSEQADLKDLLASPETLLNQLDAPFLKSWRLFQAENLEEHKPILLYLALGPDGTTRELTGQPGQFNEMVEQEDIALKSPEEVRDYLELYFEICRDHGRLVYRVESIEDVKFRANLSGEEELVREAFAAGPGSKIDPMDIKGHGNGFQGVYFSMEEQELFKVEASVSTGGVVSQQKEKMASNLPTVFGL